MTLIDAVSLVKNRRMIASPNTGFMAQLIALERSLDKYRGGDGTSVTVDLEQYKRDRFGDPKEFMSVGKEFKYCFYRAYTKNIYNLKVKEGKGKGSHRRNISATNYLLPIVEKYLTKKSTTANNFQAEDRIPRWATRKQRTLKKNENEFEIENENENGENRQTAANLAPVMDVSQLEMAKKTLSGLHDNAMNRISTDLIDLETEIAFPFLSECFCSGSF